MASLKSGYHLFYGFRFTDQNEIYITEIKQTEYKSCPKDGKKFNRIQEQKTIKLLDVLQPFENAIKIMQNIKSGAYLIIHQIHGNEFLNQAKLDDIRHKMSEVREILNKANIDYESGLFNLYYSY
jgi:hypothetical protein